MQSRRRKKWERAIEWSIGDLGYTFCSITRIDILSATENGIEMASLRCKTKRADSTTILFASKKPTQIQNDAPDTNTLLTQTELI